MHPHRWGAAALLASVFLAGGSLRAATSASSASSAPSAPPAPFERHPDIHGDSVVFESEGDLWIGSLATGHARRITNSAGEEMNAHWSPDGTRIAFTAQYDGALDVYVMPAEGGAPERLTWDPMGAIVLGWTPDGKNILFRTRRQSPDGRRRLWEVPATGGMPALLPIPKVEHAAMAPDGRRVAYVPISSEWQHWKRYKGGLADDIWLTDITTHTFQRLTDDPGIDTTPTWADGQIYFVSERDGLANLYRLDPATKHVAAVTRFTDLEVRYPSSDGKRVVFQHGNGIGLYDPASNTTRDITFPLASDRIHTLERRVPALNNLVRVTIGPTGKRVLLEARGQIVSAPVEDGDWRVLASKPGSRSQYPSWSPDGKRVAFVSDRSGEEEVWVAPAMGLGAPRQLTKAHKGPLGPIVWSPDGKWIATSDREARILLVDAKTGATTLVDQADRSGTYDNVNSSYRFSPDGKYLAFARTQPNWYSVVCLYDIAGKRKVQITPDTMNSWSPAFDPQGKYLYFLSDRELDPTGSGPSQFFAFDKTARVSLVTLAKDTKSPFIVQDSEEGQTDADKKDDSDKKDATTDKKPAVKGKAAKAPKAVKGPGGADLPKMKVDLDGIADRIVDVPVPADRYQSLDGVADRLLMLVNADGDGGPHNQLRALNMKDTRKKEVTTLMDRLDSFAVSADRKKLLLQKGKDYFVVDASTGPVTGTTGKVEMGGIQLVVEPEEEWKQIFNEAWRIGRDFFYDPNMHGVDWNAVKVKYAAQLPNVGDRSELNELLGDMIAELSVGHAYVGGGDVPGSVPSVGNGYLGADLEPDAGGKAYRITKIFPGDGYDLAARSPLLTPGVNVKTGDYILAVAGQPVSTNQDIEAMLVGMAGQVVTLTVNDKPVLKGAREVRVRPMATESRARYYDWVASRREYVRTHGGENLGYVQIPDMGDRGLQEFTKSYYAINQTKDGIVYDIRNNGGGYIAAMLLLQMAAKPRTYYKPRYGASWTYEGWAFPGYSVALSNENDYSDAEYFLDAFQRLGLGPVVGTRTGGGEVGSGEGWPFLDGGKINIPNYGEWSPDGHWVIEGHGVTPDIDVEQDPKAVLDGQDPQLDRAIAYLKEQIAKKPVPHPTPPPFPNKAWKPQVATKG